jgi:hypothetical protein
VAESKLEHADRVSLTDSRGIRHSVEVSAESLFEAGVLAVTTLRKAGWVEESPRLASRLEIEVREPAVKHIVTLAQIKRWAKATRSSCARYQFRMFGRSAGSIRRFDGLLDGHFGALNWDRHDRSSFFVMPACC